MAVGGGTGCTGGGSVRVVASDNVMVVFTAFVVCRVVPATQGTFRRRVYLLSAICSVVGLSAFDARIGFIAICSGVPVLLASDTLWDVFIVHPRRFYVDNFVLQGRYIIDAFIVIDWFQVNKKRDLMVPSFVYDERLLCSWLHDPFRAVLAGCLAHQWSGGGI